MIRTLTMTEEQFNALVYMIGDTAEVYAGIKEDEFETTEEWQECVKTGDILVDMYNNQLIPMTEYKIDQEDIDAERLYFKYRDSIDRDWSTIGCWMVESVPTTISEIEEEIYQAEYGLTYDQIEDLEYEEPADLPYEETWEYKRMVVSSAIEYMLKDAIRG